MKKSFKEKIIIYYRKTIEKHTWLRVPAFVILSGILFGYHVLAKFFGAWKKYAFTAFLLLMFLAGSSFTYPVFGEGEGFIAPEAEPEAVAVAESTIELAEEDEVLPEEIELLEDADVLEGYEDAELHGIEELDKYSLADILEGSQLEGEEPTGSLESTEIISFSADDWRLILINKQHPIPEDYTFNLGTIKGSMQCDERIINDLLQMLQDAQDDGISLVICSPYRDLSRQEILFNRKIEAYMRKGMSYLEAYKLSSQSVTVPGASEHQIGLAIDIISDTYFTLDAGFAETEAGKWLSKHSSEHGFILRYPQGKEYITGIEFEPWHFRYVGKEAAAIIAEQGITLEEFVDKHL